jgi:uroporphyrinogen decarboxylase
MTARERVEAALSFEPVDRVPLYDLIQHPELLEHCTGRAPTVENSLELLCETIAAGLDATRGVAGFGRSGSWRDEEGFLYEGEWWTSWIVERPFREVTEALAFVRSAIDRLDSLPTEAVYTFFGPGNVTTGAEPYDSRDRFLALRERLGGAVLFHMESPVGLDTAFHRLGLDTFCYAYAEDPGLLSEWLEALNRHEVARVRALQGALEMSPAALVYSDIADSKATIFSPAFLRKELMPRLERLVAAWHEQGVRVIFHSDGNLWDVLDDLVATGIDGLNPLEPLSRMDAVQVRARYPKLVLAGGIDASQLLCYGTPAQVRLEVERVLDATQGRGILLGSSTEIHPACALGNVLAMWEAAHAWRPRGSTG